LQFLFAIQSCNAVAFLDRGEVIDGTGCAAHISGGGGGRSGEIIHRSDDGLRALDQILRVPDVLYLVLKVLVELGDLGIALLEGSLYAVPIEVHGGIDGLEARNGGGGEFLAGVNDTGVGGAKSVNDNGENAADKDLEEIR
jgi:hypothetical protein